MATHSSIPAWEIPSSVHGVPKSRHDWAHTHKLQIPGTGRFQSQPCATAVCHTRAWPVAWSSLNFPAQEQLLKLLLSCSSCIVLRISLPASHTLGILLIGLWWTKMGLVWNLLRQLYHTENHHQGAGESRHSGEKCGKAVQWGARRPQCGQKGSQAPTPTTPCTQKHTLLLLQNHSVYSASSSKASGL